MAAVRDSEVWVEASFGRGTIWESAIGNILLVGSFVGDNLVLTNHHVLTANPGIPRGEVILTVGWGGKNFPVEILAEDSSRDLLLLKVLDPARLLGKKPVDFVVTDSIGAERLRLPWLALGLMGKDFIVPVEFPMFLGYFLNERGDEVKFPIMAIKGEVQGGFSGAPVLDNDGKCRGVAFRTRDVVTLVVGADQIEIFLENANVRRASPFLKFLNPPHE